MSHYTIRIFLGSSLLERCTRNKYPTTVHFILLAVYNIIIMIIARRRRSFIIDERYRVTQREPSTWAQRQNTSPARSRTSSARDTMSVISKRRTRRRRTGTHTHTPTRRHTAHDVRSAHEFTFGCQYVFFLLLIRFSHCGRSVDGFHGTHTRSRAPRVTVRQ